MKTREQVETRIATLVRRREEAQEGFKQAMKDVEMKIIDNASDPEYVASWVNPWMSQANQIKEVIADLTKQIERLQWVLED